MRALLCIAVLLAFITIGYDVAYTSSSGAPTGHTGAPGQGTCLNCHSSSFALNGGPEVPQISVAGNPTQYAAGQNYTVTVSFTSTSRPKHGFSMVALNAANQNAGTWALLNATTTQINGAGGLTYLTHTTAGNTQTSWSFTWTAPASNVGTVTFYAAFNAANGNGNNTGDNIYTRSYSMTFFVPNSISTTVTGTSLCAGANTNVSFTAAGTYTAGNVFTAQLSNASGSFATPTNIGTLSSTASGTIAATIPAGTTPGTGYRIRVISSTPATTGTDNGTNLTISTVPVVTASAANATVCSGQAIQLNASAVAGATYSWVGPNSFTSSLQNPVINNSTISNSGSYTVYAIVNGCVSTGAAVSVTVNQSPNQPAATSNAPICAGQTLQLTAQGPIGATFSWVGPNGFSSALQQPSINNVSAANAGIYTIYQVGSNGCVSVQATTSVTINAIPPAPTVGNPPPVCEGQTLSLSTILVPGTTYTWTGPNSFTSNANIITITNVPVAAAGNYTLTTTLAGCSSTPTVTPVVVNPVPAAPTVSSQPVCEGETLELTATGIEAGASVNWTGPNNFTATGQTVSILNATPADAGTYTVTQTSGTGCESLPATVSAVVHPQPALTLTPVSATVCPGESIGLTATGGFSYSWDPGGQVGINPGTIIVTPTSSTVYTVFAMSAQGCTGTATIPVNVSASLSVSAVANPAVVCQGQSTTLTATGAANYSWSNGQIGQIITVTPAAATTYTVTGTSGSCSDTGTVSVAINALPVVSFTGLNGFYCSDNAAVTLAGSPAGGVFSGPGISGNTFDPSFFTGLSGLFTITYTYQDANGCIDSVSQQTTVALCDGLPETTRNVLKLYPNPGTGAFTIESEQLNGQAIELTLFNTLGQAVWHQKQAAAAGAFSLQLPQQLPGGLYQLLVQTIDHLYSQPLQLQR